MIEPDRGEAPDDAVAARDDDGDAPVEIHGPASEAARIVRRASPLRLALQVAALAVLLGGAAAGAWRARAWWVEHAHDPGSAGRGDRGP
jgi:hypothetical protein